MPYLEGGAGYHDTDTSFEAAQKVPVARMKRIVFDGVARYGPISSDDLAEKLGLNRRSVQPRMTNLKDDGLVYKTKERSITISGRSAVKWALVNPIEIDELDEIDDLL